ncbi:uncharacterized protein V1510DRAFT_414835 [Dipodascopsis tothii]|uniref:uncharacterized protein n=1 Tax=Dipodascopsis tothii TaxID=44089 RepID=UPI0034CFC869
MDDFASNHFNDGAIFRLDEWGYRFLCGLCGKSYVYSRSERVIDRDPGWQDQVRSLYFKDGLIHTEHHASYYTSLVGQGPDRAEELAYGPRQWVPHHFYAFDPGPELTFCFNVHEDCWQLLLARGAQDSDLVNWQERDYATALYMHLAQQTRRPLVDMPYENLYDGNDYGARDDSDWTPERTGPPDAYELEELVERTSVSDISLPRLIKTGLEWEQHHLARDSTEPPAERAHSHESSFLKYINEAVFDVIAEHLQLRDVITLRLVCWQLARLCDIRRLAPSFWKHQLSRDRVARVLAPEVVGRRIHGADLRRLILGVRLSLRQLDASTISRALVWNSLDGLLPALKARNSMHAQSPAGITLRPWSPGGYLDHTTPDHRAHTFRATDRRDGEPELVINRASYFRACERPQHSDTGIFGAQELRHVAMPLSWPLLDAPRRISVSLTSFGAYKLVCGLRVFHAGSDVLLHQLGYHNPYDEVSAELPGSQKLASIDFGHLTAGISCVRFNTADGASSDWLGEFTEPEDLTSDITIEWLADYTTYSARGNLPVSVDGECYLVLALKRFNVYSIGIAQPETTSEAISEDLDAFGTYDARKFLWRPPRELAAGSAVKLTPVLRNTPRYTKEHLQIVPTPERSSVSAHLTRIDFCFDVSLLEWQLVFYYSDKRSQKYPARSRGSNFSTSSIFLSAEQGERVVGIEFVIGQCAREGLLQLRITTNFGQSKLAGVPPLVQCCSSSEIIFPRDGYIAGLVCPALSQYLDAFCAHGVLVAPWTETDSKTAPPELNLHIHKVSSMWLSSLSQIYRHCSNLWIRSPQTEGPVGFDVASFKSVRKITPCFVTASDDEDLSYICGLLLEYHKHPTPAALGYITADVGDSFELAEDENVRSISFQGPSRLLAEHCRATAKLRDSYAEPTEESLRDSIPPPGWNIVVPGFATIAVETWRSRKGVLTTRARPGGQGGDAGQTFEAKAGEALAAIAWRVWGDTVLLDAHITGGKRPIEVLIPLQQVQTDLAGVSRLFFDGPDGDKPSDPVVSIDACYTGSELVGLRFAYRSRASRLIGELGDSRVSAAVPKGSRLFRMAAEYGCRRHEIDIEFTVKGAKSKTAAIRLERPNKASLSRCGYVERHVWVEHADEPPQRFTEFKFVPDREYLRSELSAVEFLVARGTSLDHVIAPYRSTTQSPDPFVAAARYAIVLGRGAETFPVLPEPTGEAEAETAEIKPDETAGPAGLTHPTSSPSLRGRLERTVWPTFEALHEGPSGFQMCGVYAPLGLMKSLGAVFRKA